LKPFHAELVRRFRRRAATESGWELRRHPDEIRLPLLVFYCVPREADLVDGLVELLMQIRCAARRCGSPAPSASGTPMTIGGPAPAVRRFTLRADSAREIREK
jgi:hypothetical protein